MQFRTLNYLDFEKLRFALEASFADYAVNIDTSERALYERFIRVNVHYPLSAAFFEDDKIVSFILHAVGEFSGKKLLYNAATGTIPEFRGKKLTENLYTEMLQIFKEKSFEGIILEVIRENERAVKTYQKIGFQTRRILSSFTRDIRKNPLPKPKRLSDFSLLKHNKVLNEKTEIFLKENSDIEASWQNSYESAVRSPDEKAIMMLKDMELAGILLFNPNNGRISQICVKKNLREQGIATTLLHEAGKSSESSFLSCLNVQEDYTPAINFLAKNNFSFLVNQQEMLKEC
jgi:ribosomal protein S18 acetylase RimI-like enzyme